MVKLILLDLSHFNRLINSSNKVMKLIKQNIIPQRNITPNFIRFRSTPFIIQEKPT